jgi:hypothetical protein
MILDLSAGGQLIEDEPNNRAIPQQLCFLVLSSSLFDEHHSLTSVNCSILKRINNGSPGQLCC